MDCAIADADSSLAESRVSEAEAREEAARLRVSLEEVKEELACSKARVEVLTSAQLTPEVASNAAPCRHPPLHPSATRTPHHAHSSRTVTPPKPMLPLPPP